jgi:hypothetical protein
MAMSVTYTNFVGGIVTENRGGVSSHYVADTLGSTIALVNSSGTVTDTWTYWPYGEVRTRTGTNPTPFTFCGIIGYFQDLLNNFSYVRARFLRVALARWQTVDPLWPFQQAFGYVNQAPIFARDKSGLCSWWCVLPCAPCLSCLIDAGIVCRDCGTDMRCWGQCLGGV